VCVLQWVALLAAACMVFATHAHLGQNCPFISTCLPCSGQDCSTEQIESIKAIVAGAMLCNDSHLNHSVGADGKEVWTPNGAPTEVSLITVGVKAGLTVEGLKTAEPRIASVPFESEHK
jgi:magnesium-transporting ATPase (P-type)